MHHVSKASNGFHLNHRLDQCKSVLNASVKWNPAAPYPPGWAWELTHFSRGFNAFLTASIPGGAGELSRINMSIISQTGNTTTFLPQRARKNQMSDGNFPSLPRGLGGGRGFNWLRHKLALKPLELAIVSLHRHHLQTSPHGVLIYNHLYNCFPRNTDASPH